MFQHTAARRRLGKPSRLSAHHTLFQHTAARRRLELQFDRTFILIMFQHTAARRRLVQTNDETGHSNRVSTHSRPKAAGADNLDLPRIKHLFQHTAARRRLGYSFLNSLSVLIRFNTQPPEGGWSRTIIFPQSIHLVSTHSRPKAAGFNGEYSPNQARVSTHSRPKAVGGRGRRGSGIAASFNTQPPEGGWNQPFQGFGFMTRFNTQPPEGGWGGMNGLMTCRSRVSTHSRPKAAGSACLL